jgi:carbon-monoxide dehydrogenase medium subunit
MIRHHFFPSTVKEAIDLKNQCGDEAVFVAGGTDLFVQIMEKTKIVESLIDVTEIPGLSRPEEIRGNVLSLGACLTVDYISRSSSIHKSIPSLSMASVQLGSPAVRNQATIGGNLVNASPAADLVPPLIAQGATAHTVSSRGHRSLLVEELSIDGNKTILFPDEVLTRISIPILEGFEGSAYEKLGLREALTISVASVAVRLRRNGDKGTIGKTRIVLGSVAPRVIRVPQAEDFLAGKPFKRKIVEHAAHIASRECQPISDLRATADYRRSVIGELVKIGLEKAWSASIKRGGLRI